VGLFYIGMWVIFTSVLTPNGFGLAASSLASVLILTPVIALLQILSAGRDSNLINPVYFYTITECG